MSILDNSFNIAKESAVDIWAVAGAQYVNNIDVLHPIEIKIQKSLSVFALNARRVLESFGKSDKFNLDQQCWSPSGNIDETTVEKDLWNALNLIVHANSFEVIFEHLPSHISYIGEENRVISHVLVSTDRRKNIHVNPFSMAYCFLANVQHQYMKNA